MIFNHIGIFVKSINIGKSFISKILKIKKKSKVINDKKMGVRVQFFYDNSGICYEIVAPLGKKNPVNEVLKSKKNILNHIAYISKNFDNDQKKLRKIGCLPISIIYKAKAFHGSRVIFYLTPIGYIIELIENKNF